MTPARVSSPFGWRHAVGPHAAVGFHNGIDLPATAGALVHAAAAGTVEAVKRQGLGGVTVDLQHPGGLVMLYAHLGNLAPAIAEGKCNVAAGAVPGTWHARVTYGTHLFFAVLENEQVVDPLGVLGCLSRCMKLALSRISCSATPGGGPKGRMGGSVPGLSLPQLGTNRLTRGPCCWPPYMSPSSGSPWT